MKFIIHSTVLLKKFKKPFGQHDLKKKILVLIVLIIANLLVLYLCLKFRNLYKCVCLHYSYTRITWTVLILQIAMRWSLKCKCTVLYTFSQALTKKIPIIFFNSVYKISILIFFYKIKKYVLKFGGSKVKHLIKHKTLVKNLIFLISLYSFWNVTQWISQYWYIWYFYTITNNYYLSLYSGWKIRTMWSMLSM